MTPKLRLAAGIAVIAALLVWSVGRMAADPSSLPVRDFVEYYSAGSVFLAGGNPYSGPELVEVQRRVLNQPDLEDATMMWNPPWVLTFVAPFATLPLGAAHKLWMLVQLLCVFVSVWLLWRVYGGPPGREWIGWALAATFPPVLFVVWWGQIGGLVLLGLAGYLYHASKGRYAVAGVFAALTAIKPHLLFAFGLVLVLEAFRSNRGRRAVLAGGLAIAAMAVGAAVIHPDVYDCYRSADWEASSAVNVSPKDWIQPLLSYWLRVAVDPNRFVIQFVPTVVAAVGVAGYWWRRRATWDWPAETPRLVFVSVLTAAYGAWLFDLVVLLVPATQATAVVLARAARPTPHGKRRANFATQLGLLYALVVSFVVYLPTFGLTPLTGHTVGLHYYVWFAPAVLGFYVAALRLGRPYSSPREAGQPVGGPEVPTEPSDGVARYGWRPVAVQTVDVST
jgi:hypothetical protein